jgi:hypothetical protein
MAVFGFADAAARLVLSGVDVWKISNVSASDAFVSLGLLKDGKVSVKSLAETDTRKRGHAYGYQIEITAKGLYTNKAAVLELLSAVSASGPLYQKITFVNAGTICGQWGFSWKFVCEGDTEKIRYIEYKATFASTWTTWAALWATPGADGTPSGTLAAFAPATMYTSQCTALKFVKTGEAAETVGLFRDFKFEIGSKVFKMDSQGREYSAGVEFTLEFNMLQATSTELLLLDDVAQYNGGFTITLGDGTAFALSGGLAGTEWDFQHDNDSEDAAVIHVKGTGILTLAEYDTAIS